MKSQTLITLAASVALNLTVLAGLDWSAQQAQAAPEGIVSVVQLPESTELQAYAQVSGSPTEARL